MANPIKSLFRKRDLKKYAWKDRTGLVPISAMDNVFVLVDSNDPDADACVPLINGFFRKAGIRPDIFFIASGQRKKGRLKTNPVFTFLPKDLNWYGRLKKRLLRPFLDARQDLYIDLTGRQDFPVEFLATAVPAKFKVGCRHIGENIFDLTVTPSPDSGFSSPEMFREIAELLLKVK